MILAGVLLLERFDWMFYIFGALLLYSASKMIDDGEGIEPANSPIIKLVKRYVPVTKGYHGQHFWIKRRGIRAATLLFIALIIVETTNVIFAVDSIPTI